MNTEVLIMPCLDMQNGRVVKGVHFVDINDAGDPVECAKAYCKAGADELAMLVNDHRNMFPYMEQPGVGPFRVTAMPIKFSQTETRIYRPAPALGQHNQEVYGQYLGFDEEKLAQLKEKGII